MFKNLFKFEIIKKKKILLFFSILLIAVIIIILISTYFLLSKDNTEKKSLYLITQYNSKEELQSNINSAKISLEYEKEDYKKAIESNANKAILSYKKNNIAALTRMIVAMEKLYDKDIPYKNVVEYHSFDKNNGSSAIISYVGIVAIIVQILLVLKIALIMPTEIKEGQAKLTLTITKNRIKYIAFKWAVELLRAIFFIIIFSMLAFLIVAIFFPIKSTYILCATTQSALILTAFQGCLFQLCFSIITIIFCSLIAIAISLMVNKQSVSVICSLLLCFSGKLFEFIQKIFEGGVIINRWLLPNNLILEKIFYDINANNILFASLIDIVSIIVLLVISLTKFKKKDIL